jgi:hypothetical protein
MSRAGPIRHLKDPTMRTIENVVTSLLALAAQALVVGVFVAL